MKWTISKDGKVLCVTTVPYDKATLREMKKAGYKVTESTRKEQMK